MSSLRAGIIGLGQMGRNHARVYRSLPGVDLVVLADSEKIPEEVSRGIETVRTAEEMLDHKIDFCIVATPTISHEEIGVLMAEAGVHTLIEKPISDNSEGAKRLIASFEKAQVIGCVGHIERFNPAIQSMKERIKNGDLGSIFQISTRRQGPFVPRVRDVGVIKDLGTHDFDLSIWLVDEPVVGVSARTALRMGREHEDLAAVTSEFNNSVVGNHLVNWISPFKERTVQVTGERGSFVADMITADLTFWSNGYLASEWETLKHSRGVVEGDVVRYAISKTEPLQEEAQAFRDSILGKSNNVVSLQEGLTVLKVAEACLESAKTGQTVVIPEEL